MPNFKDRIAAAMKAFRLGPAVVSPSLGAYGIAPEAFSPETYGEFQAKSVGVYAATNLRANNLAGLDLAVYKTRQDGERERITTGALVELLRKVNPFWTWNRLIRMTELSLCSWGAGFWYVDRGPSGKGKPQAIWWMRSDRVTVLPDAVDYLKGFIYEAPGGDKIAFAPDEVIWFRYPNILDEFAGLSPIASARLSIEMGVNALRSNKSIFDQGYQIPSIISPAKADQVMTAEQARSLEEMLARRHKGVDRAHKIAVLNQAISVDSVAMSPKDAEFLGMMRWSLGDICRVFQVPPPLVQDFERATYNNADAAYKALWNDCLLPEARFIAAEITEQLLPMFGDADHAEFDVSRVPVLQEDRGEITAQAEAWFGMGVPLNRVLQVYAPELLPAEGEGYPWGDEPGGASAAQPAPVAGAQEPPDDGTPAAAAQRALKAIQALRVAKAIEFGGQKHVAMWKAFDRRATRHERKFAAMVEGLFAEQLDAVLARLGGEKAIKARHEEPFDRKRWKERFVEAAQPLITDAVEDAGSSLYGELSLAIDFDVKRPEVREFIAERSQRFAEQVNETTWDALKTALTEGQDAGEGIDQLAARVQDTMGTRIKSSAETIARTEVIGALNGGALEAAKQSGVVKAKTWLAGLDNRTRDSHGAPPAGVHGETVPLDADFSLGGPAPGSIGDAAEDINCRCTLTWVLDDEEE